MFRRIKTTLGFAILTTAIYFITVNIGYYYFNKQTMFKDIYYYEWVEYAISTGIFFVCILLVEFFRSSNKNAAQNSSQDQDTEDVWK